MRKRIFSLLLIAAILVSALPLFASADTPITVYVSVSRYGELVNVKDNTPAALLPVELSGKDSYTIDDALKAAHDSYYDGGSDAGYLSVDGKYGLSLTKLWGSENIAVGYQLNSGTKNVSNLSQEVSKGDVIDAYILTDTEAYSAFAESFVSTYVSGEVVLTLNESSYDQDFNMTMSPSSGAQITVNGEDTQTVTDLDGKAVLTFDEAGRYIISAKKTKTLGEETVPAITAPACIVDVTLPDAAITVPSDCELFVGSKTKHFVKFDEIEPVCTVENADALTCTRYYELADNKTYNYRISRENCVTYASTFKKTADFSLEITESMLTADGKTPQTVDRDTSSNKGYNAADIYLNINPQGHLKLGEGDTYQIVAERCWQTVDTTVSNYFIEPDFHYTAIDENGNASDVVSVDENGVITANKPGYAIVLVTYDAINVPSAVGGPFFGAIWAENTGVFVVSVDDASSDLSSLITINEGRNTPELKLSGDVLDSEHDVVYFTGESGIFTFKADGEDLKVYVANPVIDGEVLTYNGFAEVAPNGEASFDIKLTEGRNIVKLCRGDDTQFHIITAKKVTFTVNNGEAVHPGDELSIVFDTLYHPANKLSGVYNVSAQAIYSKNSAYDGKLIGALSNQYTFASKASAQTVSNILKEMNRFGMITYQKDSVLTVPADYEYDTFTLSGGALYVSGFGDSYGNHRGITFTEGKAPQLNASSKCAWLGSLPDIVIPVTLTDAPISSISLNTENVRTNYYVGDAFDTENLAVTALYEDSKTQKVTNYTVTPEVLTADTKAVVITYKGKTAEIPVTVEPLTATALRVTAPPAKTSYKAGELFDPTGMQISVEYNNGKIEQTTDYSYSPRRELKTDDTEMTVTYEGASDGEPLTAAVPITVETASSGGTSNKNITVYFTLYGDKKHGDSTEHTYRGGNLELWLERTAVTVPKGSRAVDVIARALSAAGMPYSNPTGDYIVSIKDLGEFSNGSLSGWMYLINNNYPKVGVSKVTVRDGDSIIVHYTDDYTAEKSADEWKNGSSSRPKTPVVLPTPETDPKTEVYEPEFKDITKDDWYYESVKTVCEKGLMNGVSGDKFEPHSKLTRAMLVTILYRLEGEPDFTASSAFTDVAADAYYANAVSWAYENGIVNGVSQTQFAADLNITREQLAAMLYRYASLKNGSAATGDTALGLFADKAAVSPYAAEALSWCVGNGIIKGSDNRLMPENGATRAEAAAMLSRICTVLENK